MVEVTHSLLSAWLYALSENAFSDGSNALEDFISTLKRERKPTTDAQQKGLNFESAVEAVTYGEVVDSEYESVPDVAAIVRGGTWQLALSRAVTVDGIDVLLKGRLDVLKAGTIYDLKYTGRYERGKFFGSTQHPMYFEICPEVDTFIYVASDGRSVWTETYRRDESANILDIISDFFGWLKTVHLWEMYVEHWEVK